MGVYKTPFSFKLLASTTVKLINYILPRQVQPKTWDAPGP